MASAAAGRGTGPLAGAWRLQYLRFKIKQEQGGRERCQGSAAAVTAATAEEFVLPSTAYQQVRHRGLAEEKRRYRETKGRAG
jgi:hypothetical protein